MSDTALFPTSPREYAIGRVAAALHEELPDTAADALVSRAESLVLIAEQHEVPFEALLEWTHYHAPDKQWSLAEFRRWSEKYQETARAVHGQDIPMRCGQCGSVILNDVEARTHICHMLCVNCGSQAAQRQGEAWFCSQCGSSVQQ